MAGTRIHYANVWASGGAKADPGGIKIDLGWVAEKPSYQEENFIKGRTEEMLAYLESRGIAEWDVLTVYEADGLAIGSDGHTYQAVISQVGNNPVGTVVAPLYSTANWRRLYPPATTSVPGVAELATTNETATGTDATRTVTPQGLAGLTATNLRRGLIEIATAAEVQALTDATLAVTAGELGTLDSSTSARGITRYATSAEVVTGTATDRAVTPESIGTLAQSMGTPGYKTFPGGLILQWGQDNVNSTTSQNVTLPIAFPNLFMAALASSALGGTSENDNDAGARPDPTDAGTLLTRIRLSSGQTNRNVHWLAIGH